LTTKTIGSIYRPKTYVIVKGTHLKTTINTPTN